jgi:hypothetical protein
MFNIEQWKLDLVAGNIVTWQSPCLPWYSITHYIDWIHHSPESNVVCIRFANTSYNIYALYDWLHRPTPSQDLYADEDAYLENTSPAVNKSKEYSCWKNIKTRCNNPNNNRYPEYGGKGIKVCEEWDTFEQFYNDVGAAPTCNHMLGRIDVTKDYNRDNCKWLTFAEMGNHKANTKRYKCNSLDLTISDWAVKTGLSRSTIVGRLRVGWPIEQALGYEQRY